MAVLKSGKIHNGVMTIPLEKLWAAALKSKHDYIYFHDRSLDFLFSFIIYGFGIFDYKFLEQNQNCSLRKPLWVFQLLLRWYSLKRYS